MNSKRTIGSLLLLSGCASSAVPGIEMSRPDVAPSTAVAGPDGGSAGAALSVDSLWESSVPDSSSLAEQPEASTNTIVDRHGREIPKQYACIVNLLEHLASRHRGQGGFELNSTLAFDVPRVMASVGSGGLVLSETENAHPMPDASVEDIEKQETASLLQTRRVVTSSPSPRQVEEQLKTRNGPAFRALSHLGHIYSVRPPHYSSLAFAPRAAGRVRVLVGSEKYELVFQIHGDQCLLEQVNYLVVEED